MPCHRLHITDAALRQAWASRRRSDWPASFEAAMADPLLCRLVRLVAVGQAQVAQRRPAAVATPAAATPAAATATAGRCALRTWRPGPQALPTVDLKRRAAGDRDD